MKTPMQEHIEWLKKEWLIVKNLESLGYIGVALHIGDCIEHAESMLEKEMTLLRSECDWCNGNNSPHMLQDTDGCSNDRSKCSCKDWGGCPVD